MRLSQCAQYIFAFRFRESLGLSREFVFPPSQLGEWIVQLGTRGKNDGTLNYILQLENIVGPWILQDCVERLAGNRLDLRIRLGAGNVPNALVVPFRIELSRPTYVYCEREFCVEGVHFRELTRLGLEAYGGPGNDRWARL